MTDPIEQRVIEIVQETLRGKKNDVAIEISADDSMESVSAWDSLSFMSIFTAINEAFSVDPDFDDAIHYTSVRSLCDYLRSQAA
jgi:acyl carrier protein